MKSSDLGSVGVVIPLGGNRSKNLDIISLTINAILNQDYSGTVKVCLVANPGFVQLQNLVNELQERLTSSGASNRAVWIKEFTRNIKKGRDTISRTLDGWADPEIQNCDYQSVTGALIHFQKDTVSKAINILHNLGGVFAVDGITECFKEAESFVGLFQEHSLIREFTRYRDGGELINISNFGTTKHTPTLTSFFMTKEYYTKFVSMLYMRNVTTNGLDDFTLAYEILKNGGMIYGSNEIVTWRMHKVTFRALKHFTSGAATYEFFQKYPESRYSKVRGRKVGLVTTLVVLAVLTVILTLVTGLYNYLLAEMGLGLLSLIFLGVINFWRCKKWQALFFAVPMVLLILLWVVGYYYAALSKGSSSTYLLELAHSHR